MVEGTPQEEHAGGASLPPEPSAPDVDPLEQRSGLGQAQACVGSKLDELGGATIGRIDGVLVDSLDRSPTWLVVRLGRFGRRAAVPFDYAAPGVGHVWTPFPRATIRAASGLDPAAGLSSADERELAAHYGILDGAGRLAALADREDDDPGSVPL